MKKQILIVIIIILSCIVVDMAATTLRYYNKITEEQKDAPHTEENCLHHNKKGEYDVWKNMKDLEYDKMVCAPGKEKRCGYCSGGHYCSCRCTDANEEITFDKPVIYIYSQKERQVKIELGKPEKITVSYPLYKKEWTISARQDGILEDQNGNTLYSLYYETKDAPLFSKEEGFIVAKQNLQSFLEEKLTYLGLNEKEIQEFLVYWIPKIKENKYTLIRFASKEAIDEYMPLNIEPQPNTLIRVAVSFTKLDSPIEIKEQELKSAKRYGYTVVEWGGTIN